MSNRNTSITLAMMEALAGSIIPQKTKSPIVSKRAKYIKQGTRNQKCIGCGHKKKKCTCESPELLKEDNGNADKT